MRPPKDTVGILPIETLRPIGWIAVLLACFALLPTRIHAAAIQQTMPVECPSVVGQSLTCNALSATMAAATLAGSTIYVVFTEPNCCSGGDGTPVYITDSQGNTYTQLDQIDDLVASQTVVHFAAYNIKGGALTVNATFNTNDFIGMVAVEISGVTAAPLIAHKGNLQTVSGTTANSITSGNLAGGSNPAILVAVSSNTSENSNPAAPLASTGFTSGGSFWNWNGYQGTPNAPGTTLESKVLSSPGSVAATFSPPGSDNYITVAALFQSAAGALPTAALGASPQIVASDGSATLTWSSTGATSCTATGGWNATLGPSGNQSTGALTANTTFSLTCSGPTGTSSVASVTVNVIPTALLTVNTNPIGYGKRAILTWSSTNATSCTAVASWRGTYGSSGTEVIGPIVVSGNTYSITCTGAGGTSAVSSVTINVVPTASLTALATTVTSGSSTTLNWSSTGGATSCAATGGWDATLGPSGSQSTGAVTATTTFSLTCSGPTGTSAVASVTVNVIPTALLTVNTNPIGYGKRAILTWSSTNATSCTALASWRGTYASSGTEVIGPMVVS